MGVLRSLVVVRFNADLLNELIELSNPAFEFVLVSAGAALGGEGFG